jgi:hypothetical protein
VNNRAIAARRALIIVGTILFIAVSFILCAMRYVISTHYTVMNGQKLRIVAARGETISFSFNLDDALNVPYWGSHGIGLIFNAPSAQTIAVVAPQEADTGYALYVNGQAGTGITITRSITIPPIGGPETETIQGNIKGDMIYPITIGSGTFDDHSTTFNVPVELDLVSETDLWLASGRALFYGVFILDTLLILALPFGLDIYDARHAYFPTRERFVFTPEGCRMIFLLGLVATVGLLLTIVFLFPLLQEQGKTEVTLLLGILLLALLVAWLTTNLRKRQRGGDPLKL